MTEKASSGFGSAFADCHDIEFVQPDLDEARREIHNTKSSTTTTPLHQSIGMLRSTF